MKRFLLQITAFITAMVIHFFYSGWSISRAMGTLGVDDIDYLLTYRDRFEYINGFTWGLIAAFFAYLVFKYRKTGSIKEMRKGIITACIIFAALYFLLGCNGSLMFNFYAEKIGYFYASLIKHIILLVTIISTTTGYIMISRNTR